MKYTQHNHIEIAIDRTYQQTIVSVSYNEFFENIIEGDILPLECVDFKYSDNIWDFGAYTNLNINKSNLIIQFNKIPLSYQDDAKKFAIDMILSNTLKIQSIKSKIFQLSHFLRYLEEVHVYSVKEANYEILKKFLEIRKEISMSRYFSALRVLNHFYEFKARMWHFPLSTDIVDLLNTPTAVERVLYNEQHKTKDIPLGYFNNLIGILIKIIDDPTEPFNIRTTACILLILSQTGLRISELLSVEVNSIQEIRLDRQRVARYLDYNTWKGSSGNNTYNVAPIFINDLAYKAYMTLDALYDVARKKMKLKFLYLGNLNQQSERFPVRSSTFNSSQKTFYYYADKYIGTINVALPQRKNLNTVRWTRKTGAKKTTVVDLTFPKTSQFRVRVCTYLYNKGIPLEYIQKYMGHLSHNMKGYYVRPKEQVQEDVEYSRKTLERIVNGDLKLLGSNSKDLTKRINDFIKSQNMNVKHNLDEIIDSLLQNIPIRQKVGGVCIKSSKFRDCAIDAKTNEFYCAYGVCANVFHFFYNIDISLRMVNELKQSRKINEANGHEKQVQKERNMIKTIVTQRLLPEMTELQRVIDQKGLEYIRSEYPDIIDIAINKEKIKSEVNEWMI